MAEGAGIRRLEAVPGEQGDDLVTRSDDTTRLCRSRRGERDPAGRLRIDALESRDGPDRCRGHRVVDRLDRPAGLVGEVDDVAAVGRVPDRERAHDRVWRSDGLDDVRARGPRMSDGSAPGCLTANEA